MQYNANYQTSSEHPRMHMHPEGINWLKELASQ